jgi:signal transduction histidine kinase
MFLLRRRTAVTTSDVERKEQLLARITHQIAAERRDERIRVAAALHYDVLAALFKVHFMGEALRQDLDSGRLLALEGDIPELRTAADEASRQIRALIRDLRRSSIGVGGLSATLQLLVDELGSSTKSKIHAQIDDLGGSPSTELLVYQVAREALQNAVAHAEARDIWIRLFKDGGDIRLTIRDNGRVCSSGRRYRQTLWAAVDGGEWVELGDGVLIIDASAGTGTLIWARFPFQG